MLRRRTFLLNAADKHHLLICRWSPPWTLTHFLVPFGLAIELDVRPQSGLSPFVRTACRVLAW
jgi:hypothetical protein